MSFFPNALENLIDQFAALPGVGRKARSGWRFMSCPSRKRRR